MELPTSTTRSGCEVSYVLRDAKESVELELDGENRSFEPSGSEKRIFEVAQFEEILCVGRHFEVGDKLSQRSVCFT